MSLENSPSKPQTLDEFCSLVQQKVSEQEYEYVLENLLMRDGTGTTGLYNQINQVFFLPRNDEEMRLSTKMKTLTLETVTGLLTGALPTPDESRIVLYEKIAYQVYRLGDFAGEECISKVKYLLSESYSLGAPRNTIFPMDIYDALALLESQINAAKEKVVNRQKSFNAPNKSNQSR